MQPVPLNLAPTRAYVNQLALTTVLTDKMYLRHRLHERSLREVAVRKVSSMVSIVVLVAQMGAQKKTSIADGWIAAWNSHDAEKVNCHLHN